MTLQNYTSTVPVNKSISHIEDVLAAHGATEILKLYGPDQKVWAICFMRNVNGTDVPFKVPARVAECEKVLRGRVRRPRKGTIPKINEQASRTAWKIVSDWVDSQMTMMDLAQVEFMEVFMPYVFDKSRMQTVFEIAKDRGFKGLLPAGQGVTP